MENNIYCCCYCYCCCYIEGRPKHILRYVIITFILYFLHVIDDILNNIYVVAVSNL